MRKAAMFSISLAACGAYSSTVAFAAGNSTSSVAYAVAGLSSASVAARIAAATVEILIVTGIVPHNRSLASSSSSRWRPALSASNTGSEYVIQTISR